jgi:2-iminoacetate synthase ThiH
MEKQFSNAIEKGLQGERLSEKDAFYLTNNITPDKVHELGKAALANRTIRYGDRATYVFNIQINPANICSMGCSFCNYAASPKDRHAYVMDEKEILDRVEKIIPTEVHIVGGLNNVWPYERNLALVKELRSRFPKLHIKAFTAVEISPWPVISITGISWSISLTLLRKVMPSILGSLISQTMTPSRVFLIKGNAFSAESKLVTDNSASSRVWVFARLICLSSSMKITLLFVLIISQ